MADREGQGRMGRRHFVRNSILAGAAAAGGTAAAGIARWLALAEKPVGIVEGFVYTQPAIASPPVWYEGLVGQEAVSYHLTQVGQAATTLWRALRDQLGNLVPGTGSPALLMRIDSAKIILPPDLQERVTSNGLVAVFNVCTHLCCNLGTHFVNAGGTDMAPRPNPSVDVLVQNPSAVVAPDLGVVNCPCHDSQFDPLRLVWANHPSGVRYLGANYVSGPTSRALPIIPLEVYGTTIRGLNTHPDWYRGYCGLWGMARPLPLAVLARPHMEGTQPPSLDLDADMVTLRSESHELRFPRIWGRKFAAWFREGRSRNVVCNADVKRFNLLGVTRTPEGFLFTYLEGGTPRALLLAPADVARMIPALERKD